MLSILFELFGVTLQETEFYILGILLFSIIFVTILFFALHTKQSPRIRDKDELYIQFSRLGEQKAEFKAKLAAVEEAKNTGRISEGEYRDQVKRASKRISEIDSEMEKVLSKLALPHYEIKLEQEKGLEAEKMSLLVRLQEKTNEYSRKIDELTGRLEDVTKRNEILEDENEEFKQKLDNIERSYKDRVIRMEAEIDLARKSGGRKAQNSPSVPDEAETRKYKEKMEEYYHKVLLYQLLISKYKQHIETIETKTVPDVKSLVQPTNSNIVPIIQGIKSETKEFLKQYQKAYDAIDDIHSVPSIGTTFWLSIKEMLDNRVADYEDKAILLCSVLRGLGANVRVLVALMENGSNRPFVLISLKDKTILLDPNRKHDFLTYVGTRNQVLKQYFVDDNAIKRVLYEFNDKDYISHEA